MIARLLRLFLKPDPFLSRVNDLRRQLAEAQRKNQCKRIGQLRRDIRDLNLSALRGSR